MEMAIVVLVVCILIPPFNIKDTRKNVTTDRSVFCPEKRNEFVFVLAL